jgi:hypothetical protein
MGGVPDILPESAFAKRLTAFKCTSKSVHLEI